MTRLFKAEILIKEVEKRPFIWDKTDTDYHNYPRKDAAWKEICQTINKNWDSSNNTTRQEICNEVKKKWANIRDNYRRCLVKKRTTEKVGYESASRNYVYARYLKFLNPLLKMENRKGDETVSYDDSNTEDERDDKDDTEEEQNVEYLDQDEQEVQDVLEVKYDPEQPARKRRRRNIYEMSNAPVVQTSQKSIEIDTEDDDTLFLLSFRSNMKLMNHDQKIEFKLGMLQLLKQIR